MKLHTTLLLASCLLTFSGFESAFAQVNNKPENTTSQKDLSEMTLEELMNVEVDVASSKPITTRESPGIVTLITAEEITNSGARDLIDVLRLVPGFEFGADSEGTVTTGFRGVLTSGKIAFLVDGNSFVERLFNGLPLGNHFPAGQIKQIEIIRGPGSAMYGGTAEMVVVNLITKKAKDINGLSASAMGSLMGSTPGRGNLNLALGKEFGNHISSYGSVFYGNARRSTATYTDIYGTSYDMTNNSGLRSVFVNAGLRYKNASIQIIADDYVLRERDHYSAALPELLKVRFATYVLNAQYDLKLSEKLTLTPQLNLSRQLPWQAKNREMNEEYLTYYNVHSDRYTGTLKAGYDLKENIHLSGGFEYFYDKAVYDKDTYTVIDPENLTHQYNDIAVFGQGYWKSPIVNITAGARYEKHNQFGAALVPRLALTKSLNRLNIKALYSKAFRAPNIESMQISPSIKPEFTTTFEFQTGYQLSEKMWVSANLFNVVIRQPIQYVFEDGKDNYYNFDKTGTRGVETEYQFRDRWGYLNVTYSFYKARKDSLPAYQTVDYQRDGQLVNPDAYLGYPQHKVTVNSSLRVTNNISVNPSATFLSSRYGYDSVDAEENLVIKRHKPLLLANLNVVYKPHLIPQVTFSAGVYDLLQSKYQFIMPYNGGHASLPGPNREFVVKLAYHLAGK